MFPSVAEFNWGATEAVAFAVGAGVAHVVDDDVASGVGKAVLGAAFDRTGRLTRALDLVCFGRGDGSSFSSDRREMSLADNKL